MARDVNPEEPTGSRFRTTLTELERSAHVPPEEQVTSTAQDRRPAEDDADREQRNTIWAGG